VVLPEFSDHHAQNHEKTRVSKNMPLQPVQKVMRFGAFTKWVDHFVFGYITTTLTNFKKIL
jgi:hypothetical protein